jgi:hypothetical protein
LFEGGVEIRRLHCKAGRVRPHAGARQGSKGRHAAQASDIGADAAFGSRRQRIEVDVPLKVHAADVQAQHGGTCGVVRRWNFQDEIEAAWP